MCKWYSGQYEVMQNKTTLVNKPGRFFVIKGKGNLKEFLVDHNFSKGDVKQALVQYHSKMVIYGKIKNNIYSYNRV